MAYKRVEGVVQYKTQAEAEACDAWVTAWIAREDIAALITDEAPDTVNSHTVSELVPPVVDSPEVTCSWQLTMQYDLTQGEGTQEAANEVEPQVYGGGIGQAECGSWFGS
jgi:hypothetical protein